MARGERFKIAVSLVCGACLWTGLAACDADGDDQPGRPPTRISGVADDRYFVHPTVRRDGAMLLKGCCTFEIGDATVTELTGDVDGRMVRGASYEIEIAFGYGIVPLDPGFAPSGRRTVDDVSVTTFEADGRRKALQATVPLSSEAAEKSIDFPQLQAVGRCHSEPGCADLEALMRSVRF